MENVAHETEKAISGAIKIDEKELQDHIDGLVRQSVEDTLNALLNAEADAICNAGRYQRTPDRLDTRAGSCHRKLLTKAGEVDLKVPRLRSLPFETEIIRRYQTKQSSVEEALIEMNLAGVSVRRWRTSRKRCGVRRSVPAPSATSIRRSTARSKSGGCVRSTRNIPTYSWMAYI